MLLQKAKKIRNQTTNLAVGNPLVVLLTFTSNYARSGSSGHLLDFERAKVFSKEAVI